MERHCRIHGNYGFFLGSSGGCPSCQSDRASAKRDRDRAREDAKRDRERAREEARARQLENQRNHEQANRDRERARAEAQSRHRDNNQRRETRPQRAYQLTADDKFAMMQRQRDADRVSAESQIKQAQDKKDQEKREFAEKERLEREEKAGRERLAQEAREEQERLVREEKIKHERRIQETVILEKKLRALISTALTKAEGLVKTYGVVNNECAEIIARWRQNLVTCGTSEMASDINYENKIARDLQIVVDAFAYRVAEHNTAKKEQERQAAKKWLKEHPQLQQQDYPPYVVEEIKHTNQEQLHVAQVEYSRREFRDECMRQGAYYTDKNERVRRNIKKKMVFEVMICLGVFVAGCILVVLGCGCVSRYMPSLKLFAVFERYNVLIWGLFLSVCLVTAIICRMLGDVEHALLNDDYHHKSI